MKKNENYNHPKKGSSTTVSPIRDVNHVKAISKLLSDEPRNKLLFVMGVNNGLRAGDLLQLKVNQVRDLKPGEFISIIEQKTKKPNILMINKAVYKALQAYLKETHPDDDD